MPLQQLTNSRALERTAVVELLRVVEAGQTITYATMEAAAKCDLRKNRHVLAAARAELRDEEMIVFEPLANIGLRRLTESERATVAPDRRRRRSFHQAMTGLKEIRGLEVTGLSADERHRFLGHLALLSALAAVSSARALRRVLGATVPDQPALPVQQTLAALADIK